MRLKQDKAKIGSGRIERQISNSSAFNNNSFGKPYGKNSVYNDGLKPWESGRSAIAKSEEDNATPTYLPILTDENFTNFNLDSELKLTTGANIMFDSKIKAKEIPRERLQYQKKLSISHLHPNVSRSELIQPEEIQVLYPDAEESWMSTPHILRKVPNTSNIYVVEKDVRPAVTSVFNEHMYSVPTKHKPLHKINDNTLILFQSMANQPVEHILIPDREKNVTQSGYKNNQGELMIEKDNKTKQEAARIFHERYKNNEESANTKMEETRHTNISATLSETKEVANQILEKIIDELEEIKSDRETENGQIEGYYIIKINLIYKI